MIDKGFNETNGLIEPNTYHASRGPTETVDWTERGLRITRLRLLSDPGFPLWDVSYCHGMIGDVHVDVALPFSTLPKGGRITSEIIKYAKRDGVYAKGLGILNAISTLQ